MGTSRQVRGLTVGLAAAALVAVGAAGPGVGAAEENAGRVELAAKRTPTSKTFENGDGSFTTAIYRGPVHYRQDDGSYGEIEPGLVETEKLRVPSLVSGLATHYAYENGDNSFDLRFKDRLESEFMQFNAGERRFTVSLAGAAATQAERDGAGLEYRSVKPSVDLRYDLSPTGAKEALILRGRAAPTRYRFLLRTDDPKAVSARKLEGGGWRFYGEGTEGALFELGRAAAAEFRPNAGGEADPALTAPMGASNATTRVSRARGGFWIEVKVDRRWLNSKKRRFPVVVDPTIKFHPGDALGVDIAADCPLCWVWEAAYLEVGAKTDIVLRSAIRFDVSQVPPTATVSGATLKLNGSNNDCLHTPSTNDGEDCELVGHQVDLHEITAEWDDRSQTQEFQFTGNPDESWTIPQGSTNWDDWSPAFNVTTDVQAYVAGSKPNFGWLLKRSSEPYGSSGPIFMGPLYTGPQEREPSLTITYTTDGVTLAKPSTVHSNGAELSWSRFDGATGNAFSKYEVHRSEAAGFTPSESTRLTTISDPSVTEFTDTTAAPGRAFSYKVVSNSDVSREQRVTTPAAGKARVVYQGNQGEGTSTYIHELGNGSGGCENFGRADRIVFGGRGGYTAEGSGRGLLAFDLHDIPADAPIDSATLQLFVPESRPTVDITVNAHRATRAWKEGSGFYGEGTGFYKPICTGDGASWKYADGATTWSSPGGDFDPTVIDSSTHLADSQHDASFNVSSAVRDWVDGKAPNFGFLLKAADESNAGEGLYFGSDDYPSFASARPKLTVTYTDGSQSRGPEVAIGKPAPGERVKGTVAVEATATDDRRVEQVQLLVDGVVKQTDSSAPYSFNWDSTTAANGDRVLTARATDDVGNQTTSAGTTVKVGNSNPPATEITYPSTDYVTNLKGHAPAAYWRLGETSGTTAADASGNGKHGTYSKNYTLAQPSLVDGVSDPAVRFNVSNNNAGRVTVSGLATQLGSALTAEALVSYAGPSSNGDYNRILSRNWGVAGGWLLAVRRNSAGIQQAYWAINNLGTISEATATVVPGRMHVAGTYDGSAMRLYVNGAEVASTPLSSAVLNTTADVIAGGAIDTETTVDEAAVYGTKLNAYELKSHWEVANQRVPTIGGGQSKVTANASDDGSVDKVEFYVDGNLFGTDSSAPYEATLDTTSSTVPVFDGEHDLTTKAYDNHGQVTESDPFTVVVDNAGASKYGATFSSTAPPTSVEYDPSPGATQKQYGLDVTVTNESAETWSATDVVLRYRWFSPDPPPGGPTVTSGPEIPLGSALAPNASATKTVMVEPPELPDGVDKAQYQLRMDLYEKSSSKWFAAQGNKPLDNPVIVNKVLLTGLGLERWWHYDGEALGAGMTYLVNVANGNSIVRWSPFSAPGRGLSTVVDLTYNALEKKSESPVGNNFSLSISSLSRFGNPIDIHPNKADTIAGRANRFVELTDGDGTTHRFIGKQHADGTVYWEEPDGVHLYLWNPTGGDPARKYAFTRPDDVTFFYDEDGYPTSVEDRNGNKLTFTLADTPPAEDPGGPKKRITTVTDAAGQGASPAPNRSFDIAYYSKANAKSPHIRGNIRRITDHNGSALDFEYYRDGNLLRLTQKGGQNADGSPLADRSFVFTYTTSSGDGPAIPQELDRRNPDATTSNQSTRLYSVRQPRELADRAREETLFTYLGPGHGADRWKLATRSDRAGATTNYSYDIQTKTTTVALPEGQSWQSRTSKFVYDGQGKVTKITDPRNEDTLVDWSADRHVTKVTFVPTGKSTIYDYNANGYLTKQANELGETTQLYYEDRSVRGAPKDTSGYWKAGRTIPHASLLSRVETPKGVATASPTDDFDWTFGYDAVGNMTSAADPENNATAYVPNADGTIASITDARQHTTAFTTYDANGLPTTIVEAEGTADERATKLSYTADGMLEWLEDPNHVGQFDSFPGLERRSYFFYDSFHRLGKQTTPRSTKIDKGNLIMSSVEYDANDNLVATVDPHYSRDEEGPGQPTTAIYDAMDRPTSLTDQENEKTTFDFDPAGRLKTVKLPRGQSGPAKAFATDLSYDALDRVSRETRYRFESGTLEETLHRHFCYDAAGDLSSVTAPKAGLSQLNCPAGQAVSHTSRFEYDAAHRLIKQIDPVGHVVEQDHDENGNVAWREDALDKRTTFSYDQRDLLTKVEEDAGLPGQATVASAYRYDAVGNLAQFVPPRAFDVHGERSDYAGLDYVTEFVYDALDQPVKILLPKDAGTPRAYLHRVYDENGNPTMVSLPSAQADPAQVAAEHRTNLTYFDPGWIATSDDHVNPPVHYDYTARGQQALRAPETESGELTGRRLEWSYSPDGMLAEERDHRRAGLFGKATYDYDANDNLESVVDTTGLTQTTKSKPVTVTAVFDGLDRLKKTTSREGGETTWDATTYVYDANDNLDERIDNIAETAAGLDAATGRRHVFTYDGADWLDTHTDHGEDRVSASDDRRITTTWTATGVMDTRQVEKRDGSGGWAPKQMTDWTWHDNSLLASMKTYKGSGAGGDGDLLESHALAYTDPNGVYVNGHRTKDVFRLNGPTQADCRTADCTKTYRYDARDRAVEENRRGTTTTYVLDPAGNVTEETTGTRTETFGYDGMQLATQTVGGVTSKYFYDCFGRLTEITTEDGAQDGCSAEPSGTTVADYGYDDFDRLERYEFFGGTGSPIDWSTYDYDPLDRPVEQREHHTDSTVGDSRRVEFDYVGLGNDIAQERHFKLAAGGEQPKTTKSYAYDPFGHRVGMTDHPEGGQARDYGYAYDPQGSVSLLIDDAGDAQAAYGYTAYGEADGDLTKELDPDPNAVAGQTTRLRDPLNPYRYTGKRLDTGSAVASGGEDAGTRTAGQGTLDMGARRFGPDVGRFLQPDAFTNALSDLSLSLDPINQNRYSLAGGNPVSYVEVDGHYAATVDRSSRHISIQGSGSYDREKGKFTSGPMEGRGHGDSQWSAPNDDGSWRRYNASRRAAEPVARREALRHCAGGNLCTSQQLAQNEENLFWGLLAGEDEIDLDRNTTDPGWINPFDWAGLSGVAKAVIKRGLSTAGAGGATKGADEAASGAPRLPGGVNVPIGNAKYGLDHIVRRHRYGAVTTTPASKFSRGLGAHGIRRTIREAVGAGGPWRAEGSSRVLETSLGRTIGTDLAGNATSRIRIVTDDAGSVITAYPIP